jgi:hypothetical protein
MDPQLITADDKNQAAGGSLRSPEFRRTLRLVWPHRRFIFIGLLASIVFGLLHSVSIVGVLPVLKVMLTEEGLHGWADQAVATERLGFELVDHPRGLLLTKPRRVQFDAEGVTVDLSRALVLTQFAIPDSAGGDPAYRPIAKLFETLAQKPELERVLFSAIDTEAAASAPRTITHRLRAPPWTWRTLHRIVSLVPKPQQRPTA